MKRIIGILVLIGAVTTSLTSKELVGDYELLDEGWDKHFKEHKPKSDHLDVVKFRDIITSDTVLAIFIIPPSFNTDELKKGEKFIIGLSQFGKIKESDYNIKINAINKADLAKYEGFLLISIEKKY